MNLPTLVYDDLTGRTTTSPRPIRAGVRWCCNLHDARAAGVPLRRWAPWALACEAKSACSCDDPLPIVRGALWRLPRRLGRGSRGPEPDAAAALDPRPDR